MNIRLANHESFTPTYFHIYPFYGKSTCFCWNREKLAVISYPDLNTSSAQLYTAPNEIKQVQCYSGRIFIICSPKGVYKFARDGGFGVLSKSAVGTNTLFYEVFIPQNGYLCLVNKTDRTSKQLFPLSPSDSESNEFCILPLNAEDADKEFIGTIISSEAIANQDVCMIGYQEKLFKLVQGTAYLVYKNTYPLSQIVPILKDSKIKGLILVSDKDSLVVIHSKGNKIVFETIYLGTTIKTICAGFSHQMENTLWMIYSDGESLFYAKKQLSVDGFYKIQEQNKIITCLKCYDSKTILALSDTSQLLELSIEEVERRLSSKEDSFVDLHKDMLHSTKSIVHTIFERTELLDKLNQNLLAAQERLKRISLYTQKRKIRTRPEICLGRICRRSVLTARFGNVFLLDSWIVLSLRSKFLTTFCSKKVASSDITLELQIPENITPKDLEITVDLITDSHEEKPWCLMRDCINENSNQEKRRMKLKPEKMKFLDAKLAILRKLAQNGHVDMKKLLEMKRSIRKELGDT